MANHFLTKTQIDLGQCLSMNDQLVLEQYPEWQAALLEKAGPETARLFAEPLLSRGNDTAPASVSWYVDVAGTGQSASRLDNEAQARLHEKLTDRLAPLAALVDDPELGPLASAALHQAGVQDVWSVDGEPVLINWGMLPGSLEKDTPSRTAHFASTLGRFLPLAGVPALTENERATRAAAQAQAAAQTPDTTTAAEASSDPVDTAPTAPQATAPAQPMAAASAPPPPPSSQPEEVRPIPRAAWVPLVLLLVLATGVLIWLLLPGTRIFQPKAENRVITDEAALVAAENTNRALRDRLASLQNALDRSVCTADGTLLMPDGRTIEGLLPPDPNDRTDIPGAVRPATAQSLLPPDPERVQVPESASAQSTTDLLAYIEERTAIVLVPHAEGFGTGTGFFVGPGLLVTNDHVIKKADSNGIFITNDALGTVHRATVVKAEGPFEATGRDFALLSVPNVNQPAFSILTPDSSLRLQSVIAAGYPGDLLQSDEQFQRLRNGDRSAVPQLAVTDGTVANEQSINSARVVVHSAPISTGNSGGPLVDMCGNLVGVNTFARKSSLRTLNFALASGDLIQFLSGTGSAPQVVTQSCSPQVARPAVPQQAAQVDAAPEPTAPLPKLEPIEPIAPVEPITPLPKLTPKAE